MEAEEADEGQNSPIGGQAQTKIARMREWTPQWIGAKVHHRPCVKDRDRVLKPYIDISLKRGETTVVPSIPR